MRVALIEYFRPIVEFFRRNGIELAVTLLLFVGLYKLPDQIIGVMAGPFYLDLGFTKSQIATVSKVYGVWLGFAGALLGGIGVTILGVRRSLLIAALGVALSNLAFLLMAAYPGQNWSFIAAISADNFCQGFAGSVLVAFMSGLADVRFSATQYALLASLSNMPGKLLGGVSGFFVEAFGYETFFALSAASIVPTLWLYWRLRPQMEQPAARRLKMAPLAATISRTGAESENETARTQCQTFLYATLTMPWLIASRTSRGSTSGRSTRQFCLRCAVVQAWSLTTRDASCMTSRCCRVPGNLLKPRRFVLRSRHSSESPANRCSVTIR